MKKKLLIGATIICVPLLSWIIPSTDKSESILKVKVEKGNFLVEVTTTGELEAKNSVKIVGPGNGMREARIWDTRINDLVPEGTLVKKGDVVAQLDASTLDNNIKNSMDDLTKVESEYTTTKLDTTLTMREQRDKLLNMEFIVEEKKIKLEQSAFEPPATIKQARMELEKAERELSQQTENYQIKKEQMNAKMTVATANREKKRRHNQMLVNLRKSFTIKAPEDGMVIYAKNWSGAKIKAGDQIRAWNPVVATLPDLSRMISRTYVNEVDIRKVKPNQEVQIGLDAFPDKTLTGKVIEVANVGEQRPNSDSKVFEVTILIHETDSILRPSMTTSNTILTQEIPDCLYVPLEALHTQGDSINYIIEDDGSGFKKKEVMIGSTNDQLAVILQGTEEGNVVALNEPEHLKNESVQLLK